MNELEFDAALSARLKGCMGARCPAADLTDRLKGSIRHSRRMFRIRLAAFVALVSVAMILVGGMVGREAGVRSSETSLIAADGEQENLKSVGWMFLGLFRNVFMHREKPQNRKKGGGVEENDY